MKTQLSKLRLADMLYDEGGENKPETRRTHPLGVFQFWAAHPSQVGVPNYIAAVHRRRTVGCEPGWLRAGLVAQVFALPTIDTADMTCNGHPRGLALMFLYPPV